MKAYKKVIQKNWGIDCDKKNSPARTLIKRELDKHDEIKDFDTSIETTTKRRDFLRSSSVKCPECGEEQVELTQFFRPPAQWKCRGCKHKFDFEP